MPLGILLFEVKSLDSLCHKDGRSAADAVLFATGQTLARNSGANGVAGRWRGWRFLVLLKGCGEAALAESGQRLLSIAHGESVPWWGDRISVDLSAGGTVVRSGDTPEAMAARAATALRGALESGDSKVVLI